MGILTTLLLAPVLAPLQGALWVAKEVARIADEKINDPAAIRAELVRFGDMLDRGEITEEQFEEVEAVLIQRLKDNQARERGEA